MRLLGSLAFSACVLSSLAIEAQAPYQERDFLSRIRRLTVEGKRAGEGYWSPDGKRLVFQSEREPGNPFYQIYTLDLTTGNHHAHLPRCRQDDVRIFSAGAWRPWGRRR